MSKQDDDKLKKKRLFIAFGVLAVFVVIMSIAVVLMRPKPKHQASAVVKTITPSTTLSQQSWIAKSQAQMERQQREIQKLKNAQAKLQREQILKKYHLNSKPQKKQSVIASAIVPKKTSTVNYPPPPKLNRYTNSNIHDNFNKQQPSPPQVTQREENNLIAVALPIHYPQSEQQTTNEIHNKQQTLREQQTPYLPTNNKRLKQQTNHSNRKPIYIIPPGSFVAAFLLTGADVPTSGHGSVGPIPVVLRIIKNTQMPNLWKANIKSCFMLGQATGSLAAERAYIRIDTLSCIDKSGKTIVRSMHGYVTGADGKVGLVGRVVSKQGAMLARTLISGFLQGVGQAFSQSQQTISISPLGQTESVAPDTKTMLRYGIGGGVGKSTEMLAKFYMKMANQMFPVIEINAGRKVDVIFLKGVKL